MRAPLVGSETGPAREEVDQHQLADPCVLGRGGGHRSSLRRGVKLASSVPCFGPVTRNRIVATGQVRGHRQIPVIQQWIAIKNRGARRSTPKLLPPLPVPLDA